MTSDPSRGSLYVCQGNWKSSRSHQESKQLARRSAAARAAGLSVFSSVVCSMRLRSCPSLRARHSGLRALQSACRRRLCSSSSSSADAPCSTLREFGYRALCSSDASAKADLTLQAAAWWKDAQKESLLGNTLPPSAPTRPARPLLYAPKDMPPPSAGHAETLLHNLAHIELNAIEIGWDVILRFQDPKLPLELYSDWLSILVDEASHFHLLNARLHALGSHYGALPAHNNLWKVAEQTADSLLARIAMVQLVQEARGLDSHQRLVSKVCTAVSDSCLPVYNMFIYWLFFFIYDVSSFMAQRTRKARNSSIRSARRRSDTSASV